MTLRVKGALAVAMVIVGVLTSAGGSAHHLWTAQAQPVVDHAAASDNHAQTIPSSRHTSSQGEVHAVGATAWTSTAPTVETVTVMVAPTAPGPRPPGPRPPKPGNRGDGSGGTNKRGHEQRDSSSEGSWGGYLAGEPESGAPSQTSGQGSESGGRNWLDRTFFPRKDDNPRYREWEQESIDRLNATDAERTRRKNAARDAGSPWYSEPPTPELADEPR